MNDLHGVILGLAVGLCVVVPAGSEEPFFDVYHRGPEEVAKEVAPVPPLDLSEKEIAYYRQRLERSLGSSKAIWLVDDFEDGNLDGWINPLDPVQNCSAQATAPGADSSSMSMRIDGQCGHYQGRYYDIGGWAPTGVGLYLRSPNNTAADAYVVLGDDNVATNNGVIFFLADSGGQFILYSGGIPYDCGAYNNYQWYNIGFTIDWDCKVVDVYVDWVLKHKDVPFRHIPTTEITQFHAYNYDNSSAWWDSIVMSTEPPSMSIFYDYFERGSTCHWDIAVD